MRTIRTALLAAVAAAATVLPLAASGPVGIYGIVERVVFEPNETAPERIQVWGTFAYASGCAAGQAGARAVECGPASVGANQPRGTSPVERGYLYFKLPAIVPGMTTEADIAAAKREWADIKSVAGTGQAIGFGRWGYVGNFAQLRPDVTTSNPGRPPYVLERTAQGGAQTDLRVRPASETPAAPATYQTNAGIVKLDEHGSHRSIVAELRAKLR